MADHALDRVAVLALVLGLTLALVGWVLPADGDGPRGGAEVSPIGAPDRLVVPSIDLRSAVVPLEVASDGVLAPPSDVDTVGWWQRSAEPGAGNGQTLLTGHSVHEGDGVMDDLGQVEPGDLVVVARGSERVRYRATRVEVLSREQVAQQARSLFGQQRRDGRLVLVSCTGWNGTSYDSNVVVYAER